MQDAAARPNEALIRAMPWVFVGIWSTGFVVARFGMPHSPPMTFLAWRFALSVTAFALWVTWARAAWPRGVPQWAHLAVTGVLMHAGYLGGIWAAVKDGLGAGSAALIVGLQPVLTALWVSWTGSEHRVSPRQWLGLALGLGGLLLVVWHKLGAGEITPFNLGLATLSLVSITVGSLYQKRFVAACDVRSANAVQLMAALAITLPLAMWETEPMDLHPELVGAMVWSVAVLTLGGSSLLYLLLHRGAATRVSSLMYLVPPCTAVLGWLLFNEVLTGSVGLGLLLTAVGVGLVVRERRPPA